MTPKQKAKRLKAIKKAHARMLSLKKIKESDNKITYEDSYEPIDFDIKLKKEIH